MEVQINTWNYLLRVWTEFLLCVNGEQWLSTSIVNFSATFYSVFSAKHCIIQLSKLVKKKLYKKFVTDGSIYVTDRLCRFPNIGVNFYLLFAFTIFFGSKSIEFHPDLKQLADMWMTVDFFSPVQHVVGTETWHSGLRKGRTRSFE